MARITELFPSVQEVFFDDDTFTDDRRRAEQIARGMGKLGLTWSCNAKANVPYETLKVLRDNGLRLLLVGYESGNQQILINIKKGVRVDRARQFTKDCRDLGITIHGTFIVGLPGETTETIQETIRFAKEINPHSLQVSIAAPYPGTALYQQARDNGWLPEDDATLLDERGVQAAALSYPNLNRTEIYESVETLLPAVLLPGREDRRNVRRDAAQPRNDAAAAARGRRVHQLPAAAGQLRLLTRHHLRLLGLAPGRVIPGRGPARPSGRRRPGAAWPPCGRVLLASAGDWGSVRPCAAATGSAGTCSPRGVTLGSALAP